MGKKEPRSKKQKRKKLRSLFKRLIKTLMRFNLNQIKKLRIYLNTLKNMLRLSKYKRKNQKFLLKMKYRTILNFLKFRSPVQKLSKKR